MIKALFIFMLLSLSNLHQYHISRLDINHDPIEKSLQLTVHLFIDDLEAGLKNEGYSSMHIGTAKEDINSDNILQEYLLKNITLKMNDEVIQGEYIGKEIASDDMGMYCYLEYPAIYPSGKLTIEDHILIKDFPDQKNIITFLKSNKRVDQALLDSKKVLCRFTF